MAQTLKFGKGVWATKTGSSMAYNDQNGNYKPLPFNVERDSIATRVNKQGLIEVVGKDKLRIDYTDTDKGVALLENSSTNLIAYSEDLSQLTSQNITIISNYATSPDGIFNATRVVPTTNIAQHRFTPSISVSASTVYTGSIFAKADGYNRIQLTENATTGGTAKFDLQNGTILSTSGVTAKIEAFPNDWYRCSITETTASTSFRFDVLVLDDSSNTTFGGDGTSALQLFGYQLEQKSFSTSYIPTSGSTVQRAADVANNAGNSEVFNDSEGVLFADISFLENNVSANNQVSLSDGSGNNRVMIYPFSNTQLGIRFNANSSQLVSQTLDVQILSNYSKLSIKWGNGNYNLYQNGFKIYSQSISDTPINLSKVNFSSVTETNPFYGKTKEIGYYDAVLTDSELEYLTSYRSLSELVTELNLNTL